MLASRNIALELKPGATSSEAGKGVISKGDFKTEINFAALAAEAVVAGLSLHHACAYFLTVPVFTVEGRGAAGPRAARACIRAARSRWLTAVTSSCAMRTEQERKLDLLGLADKLDPDNQYMFGLFCDIMLSVGQGTRPLRPQAQGPRCLPDRAAGLH